MDDIGQNISDKEKERLKKMWHYENVAFDKGCRVIAGIDEAGRGPLAGPVFAGCVILPKGILIPGLNDSKKVSEKNRDKLFDEIASCAVSWAVGSCCAETIDRINILNATKLSMLSAYEKLGIEADYILIDALTVGSILTAQQGITHGDSLSASIAAASIMAKVSRDRVMKEFDELYPEYGFKKHKGYGTKEHISAIRKYGPSPIHRMSFLGKILEKEELL
ncbi:MAG: ribonuclease HII [Eubacteriales bacterium]|nr:ribonuclease HII [Eubacteriales bacterium]